MVGQFFGQSVGWMIGWLEEWLLYHAHCMVFFIPTISLHFKWSLVPCLMGCFSSYWVVWNKVTDDTRLLLLKQTVMLDVWGSFISFVQHFTDGILSCSQFEYAPFQMTLSVNNPVTFLSWFITNSFLVILAYGCPMTFLHVFVWI